MYAPTVRVRRCPLNAYREAQSKMLTHRLVAHRGYQKLYPENTLLSLRKAVEAGARFLEIDIQFTRDGKAVLYHDEKLKRMSGVRGRITDLTLEQALNLPAHEPGRFGDAFAAETVAPLSALEPFLIAHPEVTLFVEAKKEAVEFLGLERAHDELTRELANVLDRVVLISFHNEFIHHARHSGVFTKLGVVLTNWRQVGSDSLTESGPDYIFTNARYIPARADLSRFESILVVYEIGEPDQAITLFRRGADMVETFDIGGMIEGLGSHSL